MSVRSGWAGTNVPHWARADASDGRPHQATKTIAARLLRSRPVQGRDLLRDFDIPVRDPAAKVVARELKVTSPYAIRTSG